MASSSPSFHYCLCLLLLGSVVEVTSLACYDCLDVRHLDGSQKVGSLDLFLGEKVLPGCQDLGDMDGVTMLECPDPDEVCGYYRGAVSIYGHLVGGVVIYMHYRSCMSAKEAAIESNQCTYNSEELVSFLLPVLPHSIIAIEPHGLACTCQEEGCSVEISDEYFSYCADNTYSVSGYCVDTPTVVLIGMTCFLGALAMLGCCCCCCWRFWPMCVPKTYVREEYEEEEDEEVVEQIVRVRQPYYFPSAAPTTMVRPSYTIPYGPTTGHYAYA